MSIAELPTFGSGGSEPYARALRDDGEVLYLTEAGASGRNRASVMHVARWNEAADDVDVSLLAGRTGSVIDIGCGPGRMVAAAGALGLTALGVDVSETAVAIAREAGLPVIRGSVFDRVPRQGHWDLALLVDGNIGIGGDVSALLRRTAQIIRRGASVVVEVHGDAQWDRQYLGTVDDIHGRRSAEFPWAEIGSERLAVRAGPAGLRLTQSWSTGGRVFARLVRIR
jgi:SAM-dependent methyltransferase